MTTPPQPTTGAVLYDVTDRVATITLNRPDVRNALSSEVLRLLPQLARQAEADDNVDVIILTGSDPAFCAGLDLKELGSIDPGDADAGQAAQARHGDAGSLDGRPGPLPWLTKPVVGAINGAAVTGGFELALACDFLIASDLARFADTHARVGVQPGWGLTVQLPQAIGLRRARQLSVTGDYIDAETALAWGLVNEVVPHDQLLARCRTIAADAVSNDRAGVRRILRTYAENALAPGAEAWRTEATAAIEWLTALSGGTNLVEARRQEVVARGRRQQSGT